MNISSLTAISSLLLGATSDNEASGGVIILITCAFFCFYLVLVIVAMASLYKIFVKAGQPGWQALIPYLNNVVVAHITGDPWWWGIVPFLNIVPFFKLARAFGKSDAFGIGIVLLSPIFIPILGFGKAQFQLERKPPLL